MTEKDTANEIIAEFDMFIEDYLELVSATDLIDAMQYGIATAAHISLRAARSAVDAIMERLSGEVD